MKTVIRKGVFETNSSSTHSLSLKRNAKDVPEKDASFVIQSPLAKAVTLLGLIDNGECEFNRKYSSREHYDDEYPKIKEEVLSKIKEQNPNLLENVDLEKISGEEIAEILLKLDDLDKFYKEEDFDDICDYFDKTSDLEYYFTDDLKQKILLTKAKQFIFEEYAKIVNKPYDEAKEEIDFEAFAYVELKNALEDKENAKQKVEKLMDRDYRLKKVYNESEDKDIISVAKKFLYENYLEFKNQPGRKYCCHRYFCDGALDDCYCGLESYDDICTAIEIDVNDDDNKVREAIRIYLSDECKLVAKECYGYSGTYYKSGEIY